MELKSIRLSCDGINEYSIIIDSLSKEKLKSVLDVLGIEIFSDKEIENLDMYVQRPELRSGLEDVVDHIRRKAKLNAVKTFKDLSGMGLRESKDVIDILSLEIDRDPEADWIKLYMVSLSRLTDEAQTFVLSAFSPRELHQYRGPINSQRFGI